MMKNINKLALSAAMLAGLNAATAGDIVGAQSAKSSNDYYIEIGESTVPFGPHTSGKAGIGSSTTYMFGADSKVDFEGLSGSSKVRQDNVQTTVYNFENSITTKPKWYEFHRNLGDFNFAQAGSDDVWFGEWSKTDGFDHRQVYYVGDRQGVTLPTGVVATYTTYGINKFTGNNLMTGDLTANFGTKKLSGTLTRPGDTLGINATINPINASFNGGATFNGTGGGSSKGHFFGNQAASLAGIAEFSSNAELNTAFGGTKNP